MNNYAENRNDDLDAISDEEFLLGAKLFYENAKEAYEEHVKELCEKDTAKRGVLL